MTLVCKLIPKPNVLSVKLIEETRILPAILNIANAVQLEYYDGDYVSTPDKVPQTYYTANKLMRENFIVEEVPFAQVTNISGGLTATIGG